MRTLRVLFALCFAVFMTACTEINNYPTAPVAADTAMKVVLPPFGIMAYQLSPSSNVYGESVTYATPLDYSPEVAASSDSPAVAVLSISSVAYLDTGCGGCRKIWTTSVNFRADQLGVAKITLTLKGKPAQSSTFMLYVVDPNSGGKG